MFRWCEETSLDSIFIYEGKLKTAVMPRGCSPVVTGSRVIMYTYYYAFRYLMRKNDEKLRFIRWVVLFQEFKFELRDKKGTKNKVANHFSRLEEEPMNMFEEGVEIIYTFPYEQVLDDSHHPIPWFVDFSNYLAND